MGWSPFSALASKIYGAVAIAALIGCGVQQLRVANRDATIEKRDSTIRAKQATIDRFLAAQELAGAKAKAARLERENIYAGIAKRIDDNAKDQLDGALGSAERFIAAGGLWAQADRDPGGRAGTGASDRSTDDSQGAGGAAELDAESRAVGAYLSARGLVAVRAEDVRICTANTIKAEAGRAFSVRLVEESKR